MRLKLLVDENVPHKVVKVLRDNDFETLSVSESYSSYTDKQILDLALKHKSILITEDSDFGEWIFAHKKKTLGVIFLRYKQNELSDIIETLLALIEKYNNKLFNKFTVAAKHKIRIRGI